MKRVHLKITGKVQGVFFRESMKERARGLGLNGWVANRDDGSVEAMVEGDTTKVDEFERWTHRGPPAARVDNVVAIEEKFSGHEESFEVREEPATPPRQR